MRAVSRKSIRTHSILIVGLLTVGLFFGCQSPVARAAVTYNFNADTIGQTPANTTVGAGTFDVQDQATLGYSLRAVTQVGVIAAINFDSFASTTDQSVVWKQAYSNSLGRSGFTLRSQSEDTNTVNSAGAKQGYLFHVYESSVYIWRVGASGYTALWSGGLSKAQPRWFKAIAQGTALGFYYSDDGSTYTRLASTTDSAYTAGKVQYTAGYGSVVDRDYVDDIVITNLGTPDITAPSVTLTAPTSGSSVGGASVSLGATATDDSSVAGVKFYVDGTLQGVEDTTSSYGVTWNSTATTSGAHTAFAVARDSSNNYATSSSVSFTVDNTSPAISSVASTVTSASGTITWTTDEAASTKVAYSSDLAYASSTSETDTGTRVTSHSKAISGLLSCTTYNFKAVSADAASNYATSTAGTFTTTGCLGGATPSSATSTVVTVTTAATSTVTDTGRTFTVSTPENFTATSSSVTIQIKGLAAGTTLGSIGVPSSNLSSAASIVFDVTALINNTTTLDSFDSPVTISYTYTDSDISRLDESSLTMYHYHNSSWLALDNCSVNTAANKITCTASSFSIFAIFGTSNSAASTSSRKQVGSITERVSSLIALGKPSEAAALKAEWTHLFPQKVDTSTPTALSVRNLTTGSTGTDVRLLQTLLNSNGFVLATDGPGSPGNETEAFGARTKVALAAYQKARGITPAAGYFGPLTRASMSNERVLAVWW